MPISVTILITQRYCEDTTNIKDGKLCFATIFNGFWSLIILAKALHLRYLRVSWQQVVAIHIFLKLNYAKHWIYA